MIFIVGARRSGTNWIQRREYRTIREAVEAYQRVTVKDIDAVLKKYPLDKSTTISIGPIYWRNRRRPRLDHKVAGRWRAFGNVCAYKCYSFMESKFRRRRYSGNFLDLFRLWSFVSP